jgi:hypothetical protein
MTKLGDPFVIEARGAQTLRLGTKLKNHIEVSPNGEWAVALDNAPRSWMECMKGERKPLMTIVSLQSGNLLLVGEHWSTDGEGISENGCSIVL